MDKSGKNFQYLKIQQGILRSSLVAGGLLWSLFFVGLYDLTSPAYDAVWAIQLIAHAVAVVFCGRLFFAFASSLARLDKMIFAVSGLLLLLFIVGFGALPIISRDALIYHLAVPKMWLRAGKIVEIPWHEWSHFPLLLSLSYAGFIKHGLSQLTPFYHGTYLILTCAVIASFVYYKFQDEFLSLLAAMLAFSLPICLKLAAEPMSDLALTFYFGAAFSLFVFWAEQHGSFRKQCIPAVFLGLALCTKYNAILACVMFALCMLAFLQRWNYSFTEALKLLSLMLFVAVLIFLPWPVKNYLGTGNPLYPFAGGIFGVSDELPFMGTANPIEYRRFGYGESWGDIALIPLRMLFTGRDDDPRQFDGVLSPILLLALVPLLVRSRGERRAPWVVTSWLFAAGYFTLSLSLFYALLRYQAPVLLPIAALSAHGVYILSAMLTRFSRDKIYRAILIAQLLWAGWYVFLVTKNVDPFPILAGKESREEYLERRSSEYNIAKFVNSSLPENARVYLLFTGNRYFYYDREVRGSYFSQTPIVKWLGEQSSARYLADEFHKAGITHLALHSKRTWDSLNSALNDSQKAAWTDFAKHYLELQFQDGAQSVWKLREQPEPG